MRCYFGGRDFQDLLSPPPARDFWTVPALALAPRPGKLLVRYAGSIVYVILETWGKESSGRYLVYVQTAEKGLFH